MNQPQTFEREIRKVMSNILCCTFRVPTRSLNVSLPECIYYIIAEYAQENKRGLIDWVSSSCLKMSRNTMIISYNYTNGVTIGRDYVSETLDWGSLLNDPDATPLIQKYQAGFISWQDLCSDPEAIPLLNKNTDKVNWKEASGNPNAIHLLERHLDKVDWRWLSGNPNAIHLLERHLDKVDWRWLSGNPNAIHLLERHLDKVDWREFSRNPSSIPILEKNRRHIHWDLLLQNKGAYTITRTKDSIYKALYEM